MEETYEKREKLARQKDQKIQLDLDIVKKIEENKKNLNLG